MPKLQPLLPDPATGYLLADPPQCLRTFRSVPSGPGHPLPSLDTPNDVQLSTNLMTSLPAIYSYISPASFPEASNPLKSIAVDLPFWELIRYTENEFGPGWVFGLDPIALRPYLSVSLPIFNSSYGLIITPYFQMSTLFITFSFKYDILLVLYNLIIPEQGYFCALCVTYHSICDFQNRISPCLLRFISLTLRAVSHIFQQLIHERSIPQGELLSHKRFFLINYAAVKLFDLKRIILSCFNAPS